MSAALAGPTALPVTHVEACMGTMFSFRIAAPGIDRPTLVAALEWLHAMDTMFSTYRPDSEISRINTGTLRLSEAAREVRDVLAVYERLRSDTDGFFDARPAGTLLDPSGYVKGWAIQHVADLLARAGSVNHCVNGGGDVVCAGRPEPGRGWRVGVADPLRRHALLTTVEGTGPIAVATSGLAERGAHIFDPHTGQPVTEIASVTVVAADLVTADVSATAAAAMGLDRAGDWLATRSDLQAVLVSATGQVRYFGRWPASARVGPPSGNAATSVLE
jgi:thiamine biosynthesis lipoprotein